MNWNLGLRRISAVWWGFVALLFTMIIGSDLAKGQPVLQWIGLLLASWVVIYVLHRLTCWIIDGFFKVSRPH